MYQIFLFKISIENNSTIFIIAYIKHWKNINVKTINVNKNVCINSDHMFNHHQNHQIHAL